MERRGLLFFCRLYLGLVAWTGTSWALLQPNCPSYVEEGHDLRCTCIYRTSSPPPHTPYFTWVGHSNSTELVQLTVDRADNGTVFTCRMVMAGQTSSVNYTLQVAYGPGSSDITINPQQPFLLNGSHPVTLTCLVKEVNPSPTFTWTGLTCAEGNHEDRCTFTPVLPGDSNKNVTCSVQNVHVTSGFNSASKTVSLKFQPMTTTTTTTTTETTTPGPVSKSTSTDTTADSSPSSRSTSPTTSSASASSSQSSRTTDSPTRPTTRDVSTTDDVVTVNDTDRFPMAGFAGGLAGASLLVVLLIILILTCQRKRERDVTLMRSADYLDGSYRNSTSKDFYMFDNNGFDADGMTEIPDSPRKNNHHQPSSSSSLSNTSSRHIDMERALDFYQSVPTVVTSGKDSTLQQGREEGRESKDTAVEGTPPVRHEGNRGVEVVQFENPSYTPAPKPSTTGTEPETGLDWEGRQDEDAGPDLEATVDADTQQDWEGRQDEDAGPDLEAMVDVDTQQDWEGRQDEEAGPDLEAMVDADAQQDWGEQPDDKAQSDSLSQRWEPPQADLGPQPDWTIPEDGEVSDAVYAVVSKPGTPPVREDTAAEPLSSHTAGPSREVCAPPLHSQVTSNPSSTVISIANNHDVHISGSLGEKD